MAKSTAKTILFATAKQDRATHQWPVAVFNTDDTARQYVTFLRLAYRAGDSGAIDALDSRALKDAEGNHVKDVKYSLTTVPYSPMPDLEAEDTASVPSE